MRRRTWRKSYGAKHVFANGRFTIERGDRVALVGVNGAGKSTLIKLLTGAEAPTAGTVKLGHNVVIGILRAGSVQGARPRGAHARRHQPRRAQGAGGRAALAARLLPVPGDDVFKPLGVLSGGERNRYALARILVSPSNFLLLDEPTNHLDMRAKDVLLEAIAAFSGTVVFVSHDRYFIDRLATRVLEVENGAITSYEGNYEDYLRRKESLAAGSIPAPQPDQQGPVPHPSSSVTARRVGDHEPELEMEIAAREPQPFNGESKEKARRLNPIKQKQMEDRCAFLEEEIPRIEASIAHTEQQLGVYVSAAETQRLTTLAEELRAQLTALTAEWEELTLQLEGA